MADDELQQSKRVSVSSVRLEIDLMLQQETQETNGGISARNDHKKVQWLKCLERFLAIACDAEDKGDYFKATRAFVLALFCEGRLQPDSGNAWAYVYSAMPVY